MKRLLSSEFFDKLNDSIHDRNARGGRDRLQFSAVASVNVTYRKRKGPSPFTKLTVSAGTVFVLQEVYQGRQNICFKFDCDGGGLVRGAGPASTEYECVEFTEKDAKKQLAGFASWWADQLARRFDEDAAEVPTPERDEEDVARDYRDSPDYGAFS